MSDGRVRIDVRPRFQFPCVYGGGRGGFYLAPDFSTLTLCVTADAPGPTACPDPIVDPGPSRADSVGRGPVVGTVEDVSRSELVEKIGRLVGFTRRLAFYRRLGENGLGVGGATKARRCWRWGRGKGRGCLVLRCPGKVRGVRGHARGFDSGPSADTCPRR